jgi:hypothetical protein
VDAELHFERRETLQYAAETLPPHEFAAILLQALGKALMNLSEHADLPRPLPERISSTICARRQVTTDPSPGG